jgi:6-phosphogluconolactonase
LQDTSRLVVANWVEKFKTHRITLTLPVLNRAAVVMFLVSGGDKAETLREVLEGSQSPELFPSKMIHLTNGKLIWLVDRAAASALSETQA